MKHSWILLAALIPASVAAQVVSQKPSLGSPEALAEWELDGSGSWEISDGKLVLRSAGVPGGPIRRPAAIAVFRGERVHRATIELEVRSTAPIDVLQRDLEVILGYQSPVRFYYVHLAGLTDAVHNGIFLVADADRKRIDEGTSDPQLRDQEWHEVRVEWDGEVGRIDVYVDGGSEPVLSATDRTLREGLVGVGSFDDTGEFRGFRVRSRR